MSTTAHRRRPIRAALATLALVVGAGVLIGLPGAASAAGGEISGTVTGEGTGALSGMTVRVYAYDDAAAGWAVVGETATTEGGGYTVDGLAAGSYRVGFSDPYGSFADEYAPDAPTVGSASDVAVSAGGPAVVADAALSLSRSISGRVVDASGTPLGGSLVAAAQRKGDAWPEVVRVPTAADGTYELPGLRPGTYRLRFEDSAGAHATEVRDEIAVSDSVALGDTGLDPAGRVGGQVVSTTDGDAVPRAVVTAYLLVDGGYQRVAETGANLAGTYDLGGLAPGTYRIDVAATDYVSTTIPATVTVGTTAPGDVKLAPTTSSPSDPSTPSTPSAPSAPSAPSTTAVPQTAVPTVGVLRAPRVKTAELVVGRKARLVPGSYAPGTTVTYAWRAGGKVVRGATRPSLRIAGSVLGKRLRVTVTATLPDSTAVVTVLRFPGRVR